MNFTTGRTVRVLAVLVTVLYLTLCPSSYAQDRNSIELGGQGGTPFVDRCSPGEYLVGLYGRSGNWVDAIGTVCAKWDENQHSFGSSVKGTLRGGTGGQPRAFECDDRSAIVSFPQAETAENEYKSVGLIVPSCALAVTPDKHTPALTGRRFGTSFTEHLPTEPGVGTTAEGYYDSSSLPHCGKDEVAVGIFGAAGNTLDRIGLICSNKPLVKPSPATRKSTGVPAPFRGDCKAGFYFRKAGPNDEVCVTFESRAQAAYENAHAAERIDPKGAYGPKSCVSGFVWRNAFEGDLVCVTPQRRTDVLTENALSDSRKKGSK